jgi:hypothetical protein
VATYTVIAIDDQGLESTPSLPVNGQKIKNQLAPSMKWREPVVDREQHSISLSWAYSSENVRQFRIYKSHDEHKPTLYRSLGHVGHEQSSFSDRVIPGRTYRYRIMAIFKDGSMSRMSDELVLKY